MLANGRTIEGIRDVKPVRRGLVFGVLGVAALWPSLAFADETGGIGMDLAVKAVAWLSGHANGILSTAYERAPVLVTVLAALLILPVTALAALLAQSMRVRHAGRARGPGAQPPLTPFPPAPVQPQAWLRLDTGQRTVLPPSLALVRIGRHEDNDIQLGQSTVHRHHAIIHRTPEAHFVITDVSGESGNGVVVNGQRLTETRLKAGDTIQLGDAALVFESALPAYLSASMPASISQNQSHRG
jgi:hypothetical protein